ncbi:MAG: hypothetical protein U5K79_22655 [Cyclobacteriaceae bacterium]|nr:hypothetical protein [Cyclobacteriaceae bacterium]
MGDDALVGDGHAVGVIAQVADQVVGPLEGLFTIYHPVGFVAGLFDRLKGCVVQWQGQCVVSKVFFQQYAQGMAEDPAERFDRQQKPFTRPYPLGAIFGERTCRHDHVDVRMIGERLAPGMQDGHGTERSSLEVGGFCTGPQRLTSRFKQQVVSFFLVGIHERVKTGGDGKDQVKELRSRQVGCQPVHPLDFLHILASGTVPVATGVVGLRGVATGIAYLDVASHPGCTTGGDGPVGTPLTGAQGIAEHLLMRQQDICQLDGVSVVIVHRRSS